MDEGEGEGALHYTELGIENLAALLGSENLAALRYTHTQLGSENLAALHYTRTQS